MPDGGGGQPSYTQVQKTDSAPWSGQQPYLNNLFTGADGLRQNGQLASGPAPFSGVVPFSNQTEAGLQGIENAATNGQLFPMAQQQAESTLRGDYLQQGNPNLQGVVDRIGRSIQPNIDAAFAGAGRTSSGSHSNAYASALADAAAPLAYQDYATERQNQMGLATNPQLLAQIQTAPYQMLQQVGAAREGQAGAQLQEQLQNWNLQQTQPARNIAAYGSLVNGGNFGSSVSQQTPIYSNSAAQYGGLAAGGLGALASLYGSGMLGKWF